ncbi:MAG: hypothetical protein GY854_07635 [Deltaproteobacteria bacterium]|nr:hypothetical protein [Deltaproteobacteria bacterium]
MRISLLFGFVLSFSMMPFGCNSDDDINLDTDTGGTDPGGTDPGDTDDGSDAGDTDPDDTDPDDADAGVDAGDTDPDDTDTQDTEGTVEMTLVVQDAFGSLISGIDATYEGETVATGPAGAARFEVPKGGTYHVVTTHDNYHDYHIYGSAGQTDFVYVTIVSQMDLYNQVTAAIGVVPDPEKGFIVVSVHDDMNVPTVGTKIAVDVAYDKAFTLQGFSPVESDVVVENGQSFVTFANADTGTVTPVVTPPDGFTCKVFKNGADSMEMEVFPGAISVITFHCQAG